MFTSSARTWTFAGTSSDVEAKATINQAIAKNLDVATFRALLYYVAFLRNDSAAMSHELILSAAHRSLSRSPMFWARGRTLISAGSPKARELSQKAQASWESMGEK